MGHSAPRSVVGDDGAFRIHKRLELLPEEAIYLIERSALFCWKEMDSSLGQVPGLDEVYGSPMSVQQAYSEMLGTEDTTLEKYQVRKRDFCSSLSFFDVWVYRSSRISSDWVML